MMTIFPAIDLRGGKCVRLFQGDYAKETVYCDDPASQAKQWEAQGAKLIHVVDLDGAKNGEITNLEAIKSICSAVGIPCELGGGVRTPADAEKAFSLGISRVILGTAVCAKPEIASEFIGKFGAEKIVAGIDAKNGFVAVKGWIETSKVNAFDLASTLCTKGVKRIIFTDIATDGAFTGPNLPSVAKLCELVPDCRIVASGGVSSVDDVRALVNLKKTNLEGVIVGKALYDGRVTLKALAEAGLC